MCIFVISNLSLYVMQRKLVVTGPESCGKTTLATLIANRLDLVYIPEMARHYLKGKTEPYISEDLEKIAHLQAVKILSMGDKQSYIADTAHLVLHIWHKEKFGYYHELIENYYDLLEVDVYILCAPDIPWEPDPLRESPYDRDRLYAIYKNHLLNSGKPFIEVHGPLDHRVYQVCTWWFDLNKK